MFRQFENEVNSYLTEGVRTVSGAAEEFMKTAKNIQENESKIKEYQKEVGDLKNTIQKKDDKLTEYKEKYNNLKSSKAKLKEKNRSLKGELATCKQELDRAEELLESYRSVGEEKVSISRTQDHKETQVDLLDNVYLLDSSPDTPSPPPELNSKLERSIITACDSSDDNVAAGVAENEVVVVGNDLGDTVESIILEPQDELLTRMSFTRDDLLKYITENTNLTIELEDYRMKTEKLENEVKSFLQLNEEDTSKIARLERDKAFWKSNFFLLILFVAACFYLFPPVNMQN